MAEADIADVQVGQEATVTLSASGKEIRGTVTAVDAIETVTNNVVEYGVTVTLGESQAGQARAEHADRGHHRHQGRRGPGVGERADDRR